MTMNDDQRLGCCWLAWLLLMVIAILYFAGH